MVLGYGKSQYISHGRPRWRIGNMPAQATANSVMASAKRLIELRHCWLSSSRMAEISVPAWPIPIHQTKLVMSQAHIVGPRRPQIPRPLVNKSAHRQQEQQQQPHGHREACPPEQYGVLLVRTTRRDLVGDGAERIAGGDDFSSTAAVDYLLVIRHGLCLDLRVGIAQGRKISGARPRVQIGQQRVVPLVGFQFATRGCSCR